MVDFPGLYERCPPLSYVATEEANDLRRAAIKFHQAVLNICPPGPDADAAIIRIQEALFHATTGIVRQDMEAHPTPTAIAGSVGLPVILASEEPEPRQTQPLVEPESLPEPEPAPEPIPERILPSRRRSRERQYGTVEVSRITEEAAVAMRDGKAPLPGAPL